MRIVRLGDEHGEPENERTATGTHSVGRTYLIWLVSCATTAVVLWMAYVVLPILSDWRTALGVTEEAVFPSVSSFAVDQSREFDNFTDSSLRFEQNLGQVDAQVHYLSRASHYNLFLMSNEVVFTLFPRSVTPDDDDEDEELDYEDEIVNSYADVVRMKLVGADPAAYGSGLTRQSGITSYFLGQDPDEWLPSVPSYDSVQFTDVYPGIDVIYYGQGGNLEYAFVVAPLADPSQIKIAIHGGEQIKINDHGHLFIETEEGRIRHSRPSIFQIKNGERGRVRGHYELTESNQVVFQIGKYDHRLPLIIDPVVSYTAVFGSAGRDYSFGVAVTSDGDAVVAGETPVPVFPDHSKPANKLPDFQTHAFVGKINGESSSLEYMAFVGGSEYDSARGVAVDQLGHAYLTGKTYSRDFPLRDPVQATHGGGGTDAFVTKLATDGTGIVFSTYLGGSGNEAGRGLAVDNYNNVFISGETGSGDFPLAHPLQTTNADSSQCFVSKLNASGKSLQYSTFLGGSSYDACRAIAVDGAGNAYVTGATGSSDFPLVNPAQSDYAGGNRVAFASKISDDGSELVYSTLLGGSGSDHGRGIAIDSTGHAYLTGKTTSPDFPTVKPFQESNAGEGDDAFVSKLSPDGTTIVYSSFLGGEDRDIARSIAVDDLGYAYVTGRTRSQRFPKVVEHPVEYGESSYNMFLTVVEPDGSAPRISTMLGGSRGDRGLFIALDDVRNIYLAGHTLSNDFPGSREDGIYSYPGRDFSVIVLMLESIHD